MNLLFLEALLEIVNQLLAGRQIDHYSINEIIENLLQNGFDNAALGEMYHHLGLSELEPFGEMLAPLNPTAVRVFTLPERIKIELESLNLLFLLEHKQIINPVQRERIIHYAMQANCRRIDIDRLKLICLLVLVKDEYTALEKLLD